MVKSGNSTIVRSAARALDVLEIVVQAEKAPTFTMIQKASGIPKSSLSYLMQELMQKRYVQYDPESKVYYPGLALLALSAECMSTTNFSVELTRGIKSLQEETGETTHAVIREGRFAIFIGKQASAKAVSSVLNIGFKLGAHATGCGLIMLASLPDDELHALIDPVTLEQYTPYTITDKKRLYREIRRVRRYGYAFDDQGNILGGCCIAAPVYNREKEVVAAISISVLASKATISYLRFLRRKVKEKAQEISMRLGYL